MTLAADPTTRAAHQLVDLSNWFDTSPANAARDPEALTWIRVTKIAEEAGEVVDAMNGATGANPRKGVCATMDNVKKELLDVAVTALGAVEHLDGAQGRSLAALFDHIAAVHRRAGIDTTADRS